MKNNILLVHGFNVRDGGKGTIDKLRRFVGGHIQQADYGWFGLISVLLFNDNIARMIAGMTINNTVAIGHSNGCALLVQAAKRGAQFDKLILINPALKKDTVFPKNIKEIHVYHNAGDLPVRAAKVLNWLIPSKNFIWGEMGCVGYKGDDPRVVNHDLTSKVSGHSVVFEDENINWFGKDVAKHCLAS